MSALQALEGGHCKSELSHIALDIDRLITSHDIKITMQWIPGHSNTPGNDKADRLAKKGSTQEQPITATTLHTAKQILMTTNKEI
jgi:ribonuclease HI